MTETATHPRRIRWRIASVAVLLLVGLGWMIRHAIRLQLTEADTFRKQAEERFNFLQKYATPRGRIYGAHEVLLADSEPSYALNLFRKNFRSDLPLPTLAERLAAILGMPVEEVSTLLKSQRNNYVTIKRFLSADEVAATKALSKNNRILGLEWVPVWKRTYPQQDLAGHLIGKTNIDLRGQAGLELEYDQVLRGETKMFEAIRLGSGGARSTVGIIAREGLLPPEPGNDVHTTLHTKIQRDFEQIVQQSVLANHAESGMLVAIDVRTGGVLGMASFSADGTQRNQPVTDAFEPGSTLKIFTIGAAIEAGTVSPLDEWDCENGEWRVLGRLIHDDKPESVLSTTQVLALSSNIGTAKIALRLGKESLFHFFDQWGFGKKTGVDFPGEDHPGVIKPLSKWDDFTFANISFGQGITTTALQLVSGLAAYGNKGIWIAPHFHAQTLSPGGQTLPWTPPLQRRVVSEQTASTLKKMMRAVMRGKGTGRELDVPGYPAVGKTGTAQRVNPLTGQYDPNFWYSSMLLMAPYERPVVALGLFLALNHHKDPKGPIPSHPVGPERRKLLPEHLGAKTAGPFAKKALARALITLGIPEENHPEFRKIP